MIKINEIENTLSRSKKKLEKLHKHLTQFTRLPFENPSTFCRKVKQIIRSSHLNSTVLYRILRKLKATARLIGYN